MSKNILSLLSLNTNTNVDNTVDTTPENAMKTVYAPAPADHTAILSFEEKAAVAAYVTNTRGNYTAGTYEALRLLAISSNAAFLSANNALTGKESKMNTTTSTSPNLDQETIDAEWAVIAARLEAQARREAVHCNAFFALILVLAIVGQVLGYRDAVAINGTPEDPFFMFNMMNSGLIYSITMGATLMALTLAWHYARKALVTLGIIALTLIATPASAFAQVIQESDMVSVTTTSVIGNAFTALILAAFVAGAFTGIYTIIAKNRKAFAFGVTAVLSLVGAAFIIALAGILLPYTNTGYVAQDMVAISIFSAIVLYTGMTAVVWRADEVLTAKEKAKIAADKAKTAAAKAAHQAEIDSVNELARLIDTLRIMAEFTEGKYTSCVSAPTLSSKLDWHNGVNRARYMGHWPSDK